MGFMQMVAWVSTPLMASARESKDFSGVID